MSRSDRTAVGSGSSLGGEASAALPPQSVRVVIVNFRSLDDVRARLHSPALADQQVVVVDNDSDPDDVLALCAETGAIPVLLPDNVGFAAGVNSGVAQLPSEDSPILLLNPDAALEPAALRALVTELNTAGYDGVGPLLVEPSGRLQVGPGGGPITLWSVIAYFLFVAHVLPCARGIFLTRRQSLEGGHVDWLCMACLLLRGDAFDRYGPIPEDELVYAEDVAWGTSATASGAVFQLVPSARVTHGKGASGGSAAWVGALDRLVLRRLGGVQGRLAAVTVRLGLRLRVLLGHRVT